jgi:metal-sulfur cluster biosynthetic enzyme
MSVLAPAGASAEAARLCAEVHTALDAVVDPELDESVVALGFVEDVSVAEPGSVTIRLRLPTFWCSPSFAYLMAHDARHAALQVDGVREVKLELFDHAHSDEISLGVSAGQTFEDVFPDETDGTLEELRAVFHAKAFGMRQEQLVRALLEWGLSADEVVALCVSDVVDTTNATGMRLRINGEVRRVRGAAPLARQYMDRRTRVGLNGAGHAPLVTDLDGRAIESTDLEDHLRATRRQRVSMTFNAMMCRGLLETRYGLESARKEDNAQ